MACGPADADIPRPLDERATARLIAEEVKRQAPGAKVTLSGKSRNPSVSVLRDGAVVWIEAGKVHPALRAAQDGTAREAELQALVEAALAGRPVPVTLEAKARSVERAPVLPMLRSGAALSREGALVHIVKAPFVGDLVQCWTVAHRDGRRGCMNARSQREAGGGLLREELMVLGLANLQDRVSEIAETVEGRFHRLALGEAYASSLMLLKGYWTERATKGSVTVAVPVEGDLWWIADATEAELAALRQAVQARHAKALAGEIMWTTELKGGRLTRVLQPLSLDLYRWTGAGWEILAP